MQHRLDIWKLRAVMLASTVTLLFLADVSDAAQSGGWEKGADKSASIQSANPGATILESNDLGLTLLMFDGLESAMYQEPERVQNHSQTPLRALLRSFAVPGWGHYYADSGDWRRGQYHLGAEIILVGTYLGINRQAYVLEKNMYTYAGAWSGVDIRNRERQFELAVGNFRSLEAYNDYQERTRNLDRLYQDTPEYRWDWESEGHRLEYRDLRSRRDNLEQQLPALVAFMVVNRVISGISAYNRVRSRTGSVSALHVVPGPDRRGFEARFSITF